MIGEAGGRPFVGACLIFEHPACCPLIGQPVLGTARDMRRTGNGDPRPQGMARPWCARNQRACRGDCRRHGRRIPANLRVPSRPRGEHSGDASSSPEHRNPFAEGAGLAYRRGRPSGVLPQAPIWRLATGAGLGLPTGTAKVPARNRSGDIALGSVTLFSNLGRNFALQVLAPARLSPNFALGVRQLWCKCCGNNPCRNTSP